MASADFCKNCLELLANYVNNHKGVCMMSKYLNIAKYNHRVTFISLCDIAVAWRKAILALDVLSIT